MKKVLTLALAVLGFAAAQAVTINWTANLKYTNNAEISGIAVLTTHVDTTTHSKVWNFLAWANGATGDKSAYTANTDNGFALLDQAEMDGTNVYTTPTTLEGFTFTTKFDADVSNSNNKLAVVFFTKAGNKATVVNVTLKNFADGMTYDIDLGDLSYPTDRQTTTTTTLTAAPVPEPTALALLALGVAGLALKRKHA